MAVLHWEIFLLSSFSFWRFYFFCLLKFFVAFLCLQAASVFYTFRLPCRTGMWLLLPHLFSLVVSGGQMFLAMDSFVWRAMWPWWLLKHLCVLFEVEPFLGFQELHWCMVCDCREEAVADVLAEKPVAAAAEPVLGEPMDILTGLQLVLKKSLAHDGLARGLHEAAKAIEKHAAQLCVLAEDCNQPDYSKLVQALCSEHNVNLISVPSAKKLGEWVGVSISPIFWWQQLVTMFCTFPSMSSPLKNRSELASLGSLR